MKVSYGEGLANHTVPESCASARKGGGEALTGERMGRAIEPRNDSFDFRGADALRAAEGHTPSSANGELLCDPARSKTPGTYGSDSHGNREIP